MDELNQKYNNYFKTEKEKAEAFDLIASHYYLRNFGSISKTDLETLMFHLYLEQIKKNESDFNTYSDYALSKTLGITQSKVQNLRVKNQLQYPDKGYDWKKELAKISGNVKIDDSYCCLTVRDKNLLIEIQNYIEENGGFVDITLNAKLLKVKCETYIDLLTSIEGEEKQKQILEIMKSEIKKYEEYSEKINAKSVRECLKDLPMEVTCGLVETMAPKFGVVLSSALRNLMKAYKSAKNQ